MKGNLLLTVCLVVVFVLVSVPLYAAEYNEAPMLAELVEAGELPPVEERLPEEPLVIEPIEEIGEYGGTIHTIFPGPEHYGELEMAAERILRLSDDGKSIIPNICKDFELSEDAKAIVIYLRKGMKWSDGAPFTADDIMFWYEDVLQNKELTPAIWSGWLPGGELMKVEKVDDYTLHLSFAAPYPLIIKRLARANVTDFHLPKHYLKKWHIKYNPDADKLAQEEGYDHWWQLFQRKANLSGALGAGADPDSPTLKAFVLRKKGTDFVMAERNPYYWKVDPEGNQLPYIDRIFVSTVGEREMLSAKIVAGEVDLEGLQTDLKDLPLYKDSAEQANYQVLIWNRVQGVDVCYQPNQTYAEDLVLRDILRDVRFRRALSLAIDRDDINEAIYFGLATPRQTTVIPQSKYFEPEFASAYAEYDLDKANALLDEMGLKWDENHEYRLRPDGKRLSIILEYAEMETPKTPTSELIKEYWKDIGVDLSVKMITGELDSIRYMGNLVQMGLWHADRCGFLFDTEPFWWVPMRYQWECTWAPLWARWYETGGEAGEEPPEEVKKNIERWERMRITPDEEERIRLGKEILRSQAENLWTIGTVGLAPHPVIVRNNLRNVPEKAVLGWDYFWTLPQKPEQYFFKHPLLPSQE